MAKIIGIDRDYKLCVSVLEGGEAKIIQTQKVTITTPSVVAFKMGNQVGEVAKPIKLSPTHQRSSVKRYGWRQPTRSTWMVKGTTLQKSLRWFFQYLKSYAEDYLGEKVDRPLSWLHSTSTTHNVKQPRMLNRWFRSWTLSNEPTAAALAGQDGWRRKSHSLH